MGENECYAWVGQQAATSILTHSHTHSSCHTFQHTCSLYVEISSKDFALLTAKTRRKPSPVLMYWSRIALHRNVEGKGNVVLDSGGCTGLSAVSTNTH